MMFRAVFPPPLRHPVARTGRLKSGAGLCFPSGAVLIQIIAVLALASSGSVFAQSALSGPLLGFVFDAQAQGIRPILGVPGAATLGATLNVGTTLVAGAVSTREDYILSFTTDPFLLVVQSADDSISTVANSAIATLPDLIAISPAGSAAALFYRQAASVMVVTGLPSAVNVASTIDISAFPNSLDTLAVTNDGQFVLAGFPEDTTPGEQKGEVFLIPADGSGPRSILTVGHASAIRLLNKSADLLVTDDVNSSLTRITDVAGAASVAQQFGADAGIAGPFAVQPAADDQTFLVAAQSSTVALIDANGAAPVLLPCTCTPTGLHALRGGNVFQLTGTADGIIWIFDWTDPTNPRFLFVPPAADQVSQ